MEPQTQHIITSEPIKNSANMNATNLGSRINHAIASYDSKIYIIGGSSGATPPLDDHYLNVYCFNLENSTWIKKIHFQTDNKEEETMTRSYMACARNGNKLYLFGGSNSSNQCTNELLCLDMDTLDWEPAPNKNPPPARESAKMVVHNKNHLLLYGGVDFASLKIFEHIEVYSIESGIWVTCLGGNYNTIVRPRFQSNMCLFQNAIYLFGGQYRTPQNREFYLNDFYKIDIKEIETDKWQANACLIRTPEYKAPEPRSNHFLLSYKNEFLLLLGGDNVGQQNMISVWVFSPQLKLWKKFGLMSSIPKSNGFNCCSSSSTQKIYLFGGISTHDSVKCDLYSIFFTDDVSKSFPKLVKPVCRVCKYPKETMKLNKHEAHKFSQLIDFPYVAFGLLLECCDNTHSDEFIIKYRQSVKNPNIPYFQIVENNDLHYSFEQLRTSIKNYESYLNFNPMGPIEKKVRVALNKQHFLKEFGLFLKVSAFRLGEEFVYIMTKGNQIWMYAFLLAKHNYEFYAFAENMIDKTIVKGTEKDKQAIYQNYSEEIQRILNKKNSAKNKEHTYPHENYLLIFKLKQVLKQTGGYEDLIVPSDNNYDLVLNYYKSNAFFKSTPHIMTQSIDISLKAYLSVYFLKAQALIIKLQVLDRWVSITPQMFLESYDMMVRAKTIFEFDNTKVNIDIRTMQLYYNPNLKNVTATFHNGVLIYHRGKLIERYGCPLGQLIRNKRNGNYNWFSLFGLLEVPETVQVSIFRTDFAYNVMMEKLRSKLKYLETHAAFNFEKKSPKTIKGQKSCGKGEEGGASEVSEFSCEKSKMKKQETPKKKERFSERKANSLMRHAPRQTFKEPQEVQNFEIQASDRMEEQEIVRKGEEAVPERIDEHEAEIEEEIMEAQNLQIQEGKEDQKMGKEVQNMQEQQQEEEQGMVQQKQEVPENNQMWADGEMQKEQDKDGQP